MKKSREKFKFGIDFQELILSYIVNDPNGFKTLALLEDSYFTLIYHQVIAYTLNKYYKKNKKIPEEPYLREALRATYERDTIFDTTLTTDDKNQISDCIQKIYQIKISEPEEIVHKCVDFARYIKFKKEVEEVDLENFDSYEQAISKLRAANNIGIELENDYGTFVVEGIKDRAFKRNMSHMVNPTPFKQFNRLLNSGGLARGSVIVYMGKEKRFKTGMLINTAKGYMRLRKKGFYVDLENGEMQITTRTEQSLSGQEQETITSEIFDEKLLKLFRKYKRLGAELVVKRFPSLSTTCNHIQKWLDDIKREFGIVFDYGVIDYGMLMGCNSGKEDEFNRISDAFLDIKNLAEFNKFEAIYTAAHITRAGDKRTPYIYESTDIAKCIDIPRHVDAILGLQENEDEMEAGVMRLEVVEQRNGMRAGNCLFWVDIATQSAREFTVPEIKEYRQQAGENETGSKPKKERTRKSDL
jgi:KaiC/GvpD/RAD55 family RecA-like ATPase